MKVAGVMAKRAKYAGNDYEIARIILRDRARYAGLMTEWADGIIRRNMVVANLPPPQSRAA